MSKSKLTLIIDGNWLLMSRLSVLGNKYVDDHEMCKNLKQLMIRSIGVVLRKFPIVDNIIFVADGGSWRAKVPLTDWLQKMKDDSDQIVGYKATRVRSDELNWELIFETYEEFMSVLQSTGINVCREKEVEGDDWCWFWSTHLNSQNTNCIIWTKDNDLKQLVNMNTDKCFTALWNMDSGLFISEYEEQELDFLFNNSFNENETIWNEVTDKSKNVSKINPKHIVIDKILKGDGSDNIFPIVLRNSKSGSDKKFKISTKDINYSLDIKDKNSIAEYIHELINSKNYKDRIFGDKTEQDIIEHFDYNKKLIFLNKESYPDEVLNIFTKYGEYNVSKDISIAEDQINAQSNKLTSILDII